jgi:hypothetical protein
MRHDFQRRSALAGINRDDAEIAIMEVVDWSSRMYLPTCLPATHRTGPKILLLSSITVAQLMVLLVEIDGAAHYYIVAVGKLPRRDAQEVQGWRSSSGVEINGRHGHPKN